MTKYITKRAVFYVIFTLVMTFVLFSFFGPASDSLIFGSVHHAPLKDRIAVYHPDEGGALRQLGYLKPVSSSDYLYAPLFSDNPAHRVVRYGLKHEFLTFSHFKLDTHNLVGKSTPSLYGYDPAQYIYSPYSYDEVFQKVYGVYDAAGIKSVTVYNSNDIPHEALGDSFTISHKDEAAVTIKNREDIAELYSILSRVVFEGYGSTPSENGASLVIELKNGEVIDNLTFGVERFFVSSGPVSAALGKEDVDALNRLLEKEW